MNFFYLVTTAFSSVVYGVIVTAVVMALLYTILQSISRSIVKTPIFYFTGIILAGLFIIQFSLMIGAMQAKDAADSVEIYLTQLLENKYGVVSAQDSQYIMDIITEKVPRIGVFIDVADFSGHDVSELPKAMHDTMVEYLDSYIWRRVCWSLGIMLVACLIVMLFDRKALKPGRTANRRTTIASRKDYDNF